MTSPHRGQFVLPKYTQRGKNPPQTQDSLGWRGMFTSWSESPTEAPGDPTLAHYCVNCRSIDPQNGGPVGVRGGSFYYGKTPAASLVLCHFQMFPASTPGVAL